MHYMMFHLLAVYNADVSLATGSFSLTLRVSVTPSMSE